MSTKEDYEKKIGKIKAIEENQIKIPNNIPVNVYIQEADNLYQWCRQDKDKLTALGLNWEFVRDLPARTGALIEAESRWNTQRFARKESAKKWEEESLTAYDLRDEILQYFRFAYRKDDELSKQVTGISEGEGHADMIQDLNDLAVLGKQHPMWLEKINFDMSLLDRAAETAERMARLLAQATTDRTGSSDSKKIRDQAYTHLKEAVDEIYEYGQFAFRHDDERRRGYRSNYMYKRRQRHERKASVKEREPCVSPVPTPGNTGE